MTPTPHSYAYARLSPDATRVAVSGAEDERGISIIELATDVSRRLTFGPARDRYPVWDSDRFIIFASGDDDKVDLLRKAADGTGQVDSLTTNGTGGFPETISPDGKYLVFRSPHVGAAHLWLLPLDRSSGPKPLFPDSKSAANAEFSPDGKWIAYDSSESGITEVYVRSFPDLDAGAWPISSGGGRKPAWSRSGEEMYFEGLPPSGNPQLMAVRVRPGRPFLSNTQQRLFALLKYFYGPGGRAYDVSRDGRFLEPRFENGEAVQLQGLNVVVNWFDDVRARVK